VLIDDAVVNRIPTPMNCASLGITPDAIPNENAMPVGYRARTRTVQP
jgi:hypothetical protein